MISRSGLGADGGNRALQALHFAADVGDGAVLFVGAGGGQKDVGALRGFGQEHVLHDDESFLRGQRTVLQRIRADDPESVEIRLRPAFPERSSPARRRPDNPEAVRAQGPCRLRRASSNNRPAGSI